MSLHNEPPFEDEISELSCVGGRLVVKAKAEVPE